VQYSVIEDALGKADFTLLLRDQNRETRAGFPSKVGESITSGTPVIISDVGDHSLYIRSNINGFLIHSDNESLAMDELKEILNLDRATIEQIKTNCNQDEQFVYETYTKQMKTFLEDLSK
jgi:glycosyltransferase involved in cell wall biosynthesis